MGKSRKMRLGIREARLITKELRLLGVPPKTIGKIWAIILGIPVVFVFGYLLSNYDSGTADSAILNRIQITPKDQYHAHIYNNTSLRLKTLTLICGSGGDTQPVTSTATLYPPLMQGFGEDVYISGNCRIIRVNESHQLW
jgi:hypothetical protein